MDNQQTIKSRLAEQGIIITGDLNDKLKSLRKKFTPVAKRKGRSLAKIIKEKKK